MAQAFELALEEQLPFAIGQLGHRGRGRMAWIFLAVEWSTATLRNNLQHVVASLSLGIVAVIMAIILLVTCMQLSYVVGNAWRMMRRSWKASGSRTSCMHACGDVDSIDPIWVHDSPMPTKTLSSPWPKTPEMTLRPLRRGGSEGGVPIGELQQRGMTPQRSTSAASLAQYGLKESVSQRQQSSRLETRLQEESTKPLLVMR